MKNLTGLYYLYRNLAFSCDQHLDLIMHSETNFLLYFFVISKEQLYIHNKAFGLLNILVNILIYSYKTMLLNVILTIYEQAITAQEGYK